MTEIENILFRLEKIFSEIQLDYVIVGGLAAIFKGKARTTTNIDLIIQNNPNKIEARRIFRKEKTEEFAESNITIPISFLQYE